jgi:hypothetical protein
MQRLKIIACAIAVACGLWVMGNMILLSKETGPHICEEQWWDMSDDDRREAVAAYDFGLSIQDAIHRKDKDAVLKLIKEELIKGPRRAVITAGSFDDVFPVSWQTDVLAAKPECTRVGWRGYMLSQGLVWYDGDASGFHLSA